MRHLKSVLFRWFLFPLLLATVTLAACGSEDPAAKKTLVIGGIPDQDQSVLVRRFGGVADYLGRRLDVSVRYVPSIDYSAVVVGFKGGDIHLAWFGGLTGVQARGAVDGALAVAQRPRDEQFRSVFILRQGIDAQSLGDLKGLTFTFGSESSTSGHLMPRYFLTEAGIDSEEDFNGLPNFSGSHDKTWKLVEAGAFQAGALNEAVWDRAVAQGNVDLGKVRVLQVTEPYFDYNWSLRPDLDRQFGNGFTRKLSLALLEMHQDAESTEVLGLFQADRFIETNNDNYRQIESVARGLGLVE